MNLWILPASFSLALILQSCKTAPELFFTIKYSSCSSKRKSWLKLCISSYFEWPTACYSVNIYKFVVDKHTWTRKTQMYTPPHTHTPNTQIFLSIHSFMCTFLQGPLLVKMLITFPAEVPITLFISKKVIQQDRYVQVNTSLISQSLTFTVFCWWDIKRSSNNICHFHVSWPLLTRNLRSGAPYVKLSLFMWQSEVSGSSGRNIFLGSWKTSFKHTQKHIPAILQAIMVGSL